MNSINLKQTKFKLTVIFTLIVFALAILLEGIFFTAKYYNYISVEKELFNKKVQLVEDKYIGIKELVKLLDISKRVFNMDKVPYNKSNIDKYNQINILIFNKDIGKLVFSNVTDDLKLEFVAKQLKYNIFGKINQSNGYLVKLVNINEKGINYDLLFIKNLRYSFVDYLEDLLGFIFITLLFSVLVYYIGLKFVSIILKPVEYNIKDMQDFIHNAGHELKTPLSIIHGNLQLIKETKNFEKDLINEGLTEINRLDDLIESLIELSNINGNTNNEDLFLKNELELIIKDFKNEGNKKNIDITLSIIFNKKVLLNKQYFYILFSNLLSNAIKYSNKGGKVDISLCKDKIVIKDYGIGIKHKNINKIFDRFYMGSESRKIGGHGIGLSLVKKIVNIYGWKIIVKSKVGKGSEFIVRF